MTLGRLHFVALKSLGQVLTWGYGGFGALEHSAKENCLLDWGKAHGRDAEVRQTATSGTHTAAITESISKNPANVMVTVVAVEVAAQHEHPVPQE
ncbi:hypothetical protein Vadar_028454 [Vaccinium darrowii]|uniref:Uncharacterized protein n=1 Tax=Vaccinium darrowii TaxID=229202 RepID=A0ACB7XL01_9ERIC|nr:hypothetical protein Vadar_028454 [Vaccinium darrowii]